MQVNFGTFQKPLVCHDARVGALLTFSDLATVVTGLCA